jgi:hypothetical protein
METKQLTFLMWDLDPQSVEELEALAKEIMVQSAEVIERVKKVLGN